ncbi:MAG: DMT family transporter [Lentisphaeria bacterium]|nr:DMT family transporter [Lentisphaeria bacterium]
MNRNMALGTFCGILSAVSFGTNPLFALPLYKRGMSTYNVLFFRFLFAVLLLGGFMLLTRKSFRLNRKQLLPALLSGMLLAFTCLFLFLSFWELDAGIAATVLFIYPLMVALIMRIFFHEEMHWSMWTGLFLSLGGIALLSHTNGSGKFSLAGLGCVLLSALIYAVYIVNIRESALRELPSATMTFYAMVFGLPVFFLSLRGGVDLRLPPDRLCWGCVIGLAFFPALLSFVLLAVSVHRIGPTMTSVIGAFEPLTSILIGVAIFGEVLSVRQIVGIAVILAAVILAVAGKSFPFRCKNGPKP